MSIFKNIIKSGAREINIIAPHHICMEQLLMNIRSSELRALGFRESSHALDQGVNMVVFSDLNEDLVTAYAILYVVEPSLSAEPVNILDVYSYLRQCAGNILSYRDMMRRCSLNSYYVARVLIERFIASGLFFPINEVRYKGSKSTGKRYLVPYYYKGNSSRVTAARHLLSLGFDISSLILSDKRSCHLYGVMHGKSIALCFGGEECIDTFLLIEGLDTKIIITAGERIPNFSGIRSMTIEEFLAQKEFF